MKNLTVISIRCHIGIHYFAGDQTISVKKHGVTMEILPVGILVRKAKVNPILIPYTNITHIETSEDEAQAKK